MYYSILQGYEQIITALVFVGFANFGSAWLSDR
jgi:hypothetical protein